MVKLIIQNKEYKLILYDNEAAKDFTSMLPLTITMNDLNNNEKYYNFNKKLTKKSENIESVKIGDFMLYGDNCIVIFYESFKTSYSYTKIGYIENTNGLKEIFKKNRSIEISFLIN